MLSTVNPTPQHPILFFDGVCNLCNASVQWILRRDPTGRFRFAHLQGRLAQQSLPAYGYNPADLNTVALLKAGKLYIKADAALQVFNELGGLWRMLYYFGSVIPAHLRNILYDWIAKNRYRWFGKTSSCLLPQPKWKERFLD